ncbi:Protein kinase-like domain protein [Metarhizium rileyi]|uniref:Protein kinase-like domain protein n=1 Tax=Metarhizium rileyi (strain RCEF 4871) TaxID=1649241 RepID=A0A167EBM7_METRR|nr:Protein kinase-like domain protein [Metarhizium rileyi RCEF 4871]
MALSIGSLLPLRLRLWLGKLLFRPLGPSVVRVSWHRVIKGPCDPPEVEAMQYVASHTTIPVPRIYAVHTTGKGLIYIEMAYVPGQDLHSAWSRLSVSELDTICADLAQHISSLRVLQPPAPDVVSSALQNPAYDGRIGARFYGPISHKEFHSLARGHLRMDDVAPFLGEDVVKVHTSCYRTCFTHADLAPRNIIVRNGRLAAIVDWAYAGWYPEYWEFTKAHYTCFFGHGWDDYLRSVLPCYEMELRAERTLWRRLPEPGTTTSMYREGVRYQNPGSNPSAAWLKARIGRQMKDLWSLALSRGNYGTVVNAADHEDVM